MGSLRQIDADKAGPAAIGILAPPGKRTVLVVRPRALDWDLVLLRAQVGIAFRELTREEAAVGARAIFRALEDWLATGHGSVAPDAQAEGRYYIRAAMGSFPFLVCPRLPGKPYEPLQCPTLDAGRHAARAVTAAMLPLDGSEREVYLNSIFFSR